MAMSDARSVAVVGAGPAGLMAAETVAQAGVAVTIYDRMPSPARKFLLAGRGGLNLTHSEPDAAFRARYEAPADRIGAALDGFTPQDLRAWCEGLGQETFVGSSGRLFPKTMKASPLLRAWLARLRTFGVTLQPRHRLIGIDPLRFDTPDGPVEVAPHATILALGGASWPRLGSDGGWVDELQALGCAVTPLMAANSGVSIEWSPHVQAWAGTPLKTVAAALDGAVVRGDLVITRAGLEGGPIYALGPALRRALAEPRPAALSLDLKPDLSPGALVRRLQTGRAGQTTTSRLKGVGLTAAAIAVLRDAVGAALPADPAALATVIKAVPLRVDGLAAIERAISTAGGLAWSELDEHLMVRRRPGLFAAGEMLDWDAPTGGYLLQMCLATGVQAARGALQWLS